MDLLFGTQISLAIAMGLGVFPRISATFWDGFARVSRFEILSWSMGEINSRRFCSWRSHLSQPARKRRVRRGLRNWVDFSSSHNLLSRIAQQVPQNRTEFLAARGCALERISYEPLGETTRCLVSEFQSLLVLPSIATPWFELLWPWLLLLPAALLNGWVRIGAIVALLGLNFGIFVTLDVGFFMLYTSPALLVLLPSHFWELGRFKSFGIKILEVVRSKECRVLPYSVVKAGSFSGVSLFESGVLGDSL